MVAVLVVIMLVTYGANILIFTHFKSHPKKDVVERLSLWLGVNMSVLFLDGLVLFVGKLLIDGILT